MGNFDERSDAVSAMERSWGQFLSRALVLGAIIAAGVFVAVRAANAREGERGGRTRTALTVAGSLAVPPGVRSPQLTFEFHRGAVAEDAGTACGPITDASVTYDPAAQSFSAEVPIEACPELFNGESVWVTTTVTDGPDGGVLLTVPRAAVNPVPYANYATQAASLTPAAQGQLVPPGAVIAFAGAEPAPLGWLLCDGRALPRDGMYQALFRAIGTAHGAGDGSTTFNLPDYRGRFLRGVDLTANRDSDSAMRTAAGSGGNVGNAVGSVQDYAIDVRNLALVPAALGTNVTMATCNDTAGFPSSFSTFRTGGHGCEDTRPNPLRSLRIGPSGSETRPKNVYVNYLIRY
jgi:hypothetical protein